LFYSSIYFFDDARFLTRADNQINPIDSTRWEVCVIREYS